MIIIGKTEIAGFDTAIDGMRHPLKSYDKHDSIFIKGAEPRIGKNDLDLATRLAAAGTDHGKFLRQIYVGVTITASMYWWKEMDTYKVGTTANSQSTMHRLTKDPIDADCFSIDEDGLHLPVYGKETIGDVWEDLLNDLETIRLMYNETGDIKYWRALNQLLPQGWLQTRTWTANYAVLKNIYHARKNHKLIEWHDFCDWVETLPYAKELIIGE